MPIYYSQKAYFKASNVCHNFSGGGAVVGQRRILLMSSRLRNLQTFVTNFFSNITGKDVMREIAAVSHYLTCLSYGMAGTFQHSVWFSSQAIEIGRKKNT